MLRLIYPVILILALIDTAHAHFVWLERDGDGPARAYFGEWIDDIREKRRSARPVQSAAGFSRHERRAAAGQEERKQFGICRQRPRRRPFRR